MYRQYVSFFSKFSHILIDNTKRIQKGDTVQISAGVGGGIGELKGLWSPTTGMIGDPAQGSPLVSPDTTTYYRLELVDERGCYTEGGNLVIVDTSTSVVSYNVPDISIYPNPSSFQVVFENIDRDYEIQVFSIDGKKQLYSEVRNKVLDISVLESGLYYFVLYKYGIPKYKGKFLKN